MHTVRTTDFGLRRRSSLLLAVPPAGRSPDDMDEREWASASSANATGSVNTPDAGAQQVGARTEEDGL